MYSLLIEGYNATSVKDYQESPFKRKWKDEITLESGYVVNRSKLKELFESQDLNNVIMIYSRIKSFGVPKSSWQDMSNKIIECYELLENIKTQYERKRKVK